MQQKPTEHAKDQRYPDGIPQFLVALRQRLALRIQIPNHGWSDLVEIVAQEYFFFVGKDDGVEG